MVQRSKEKRRIGGDNTTNILIIVKHVYQDPHNPHEQMIELGNVDFAWRYALFRSLIDEGKDFSVEYKREG